VPGYSNGFFKAAASAGWSFVPAAANSPAYYSTQGFAWVNGYKISVPAKLGVAANAATFVKGALRLSPWVSIAGTLAAAWLAQQGVEWLQDQWQINTIAWVPVAHTQYPECGSCANTDIGCLKDLFVRNYFRNRRGSCEVPAGAYATWRKQWTNDRRKEGWAANVYWPAGWYENVGIVYLPDDQPVKAPMTQADWDSLPDPVPSVGPELPDVAYSPQGAPVNKPQYDFAPFTQPVGQPYLRPDGSTWQPKASVTPDGDGVIVEIGDVPVTDPNGSPVQNPSYQPQQVTRVQDDTTQKSPDQQPEPDFCEKHPQSLGCLPPGSLSDTVPRSTVSLSFAPETVPLPSGCPGDIPVLGRALSFAPACEAMQMLRPLVIGAASLVAAFIVVGAFRD
jgi:hypothetical protein